MPAIIQGNPKVNVDNLRTLSRVEYDYTYPEELDLRPNSKMSKKIVDAVLMRAQESYEAVSKRHGSWKRMDQVLKAYKPLDEEEKRVKENDPRKPVSIVFPYTYAIKETLVTHLMASLVQDPIFQYAGVGPEDTLGATLLQHKVQMDCVKSKAALSLHTMFSDAVSYGIGVATPGWYERRGTSYTRSGRGASGLLGRVMGRKEETITQENAILYEGNKLTNVDPYLLLPDPSVSAHEMQSGDYYGWVDETSVVGILEAERVDEDMFNGRYLKHLPSLRSVYASAKDGRDGHNRDKDSAVVDYADVIYMYVNLIPEEWGLGDAVYPEKWLFAVAGDSVVLKAQPLGLNHGKYPIVNASPDFDGYSTLPTSRLELLQGLQETVDWLFNSHIANVRKAINDMLIVDPYLINMKDLKHPEAGKLIRTRRPAWGKGVRDSIHQLAVNDVTRQHIADTSWIVNWMNQVSGVDESMMGSLRQGGPERLTGQEYQGTRNAAMTRLNKMANVISVQAMQDIAYFFASHTQQLMSQETYVKASGDLVETLKNEYGIKAKSGRYKVNPKDILVDFDVDLSQTGTGDNDTGVWMQMFNTLMENPETSREFDIPRIFKHVARQMGAKNVNDFVRQGGGISPQTMPDEQVRAEVQKGNMVPVE